jgi:hypothetical protein
MMSKKIHRSVLFIFLSVLILMMGQNCSNIELEKYVAPSVYQAPQVQLKSSICGDVRALAPQASKFIFIVDMSASNLGRFYTKTISGITYQYFDQTVATDLNAARMSAIEYFLDNCGTAKGSQFAVVGFSNSAGIVNPGSTTWSCDQVNFSDTQSAKASLNKLKQIQTNDNLWYSKWKEYDANGNYVNMYVREQLPSSIMMDKTNYVSALTCAQNLVLNDLQSGTSQTNAYHLFFVSDGAPKQNSTDTGSCNATGMTASQSEQCHIQKSTDIITFMRSASLSKGRDLKLHGIFYEKNLQQQIPQALTSITQEGGVTEVLRLFYTDKVGIRKFLSIKFGIQTIRALNNIY